MTFKIYPYFCSRKRIIIQWRTRIADLIQSKWLSPARRLEVRTNSCRSWQKKDSNWHKPPCRAIEATEGSQSCQHERELCICTSQQYHVQAHDRAAKASEMLRHNGFISIEFSHNIAVIKTRPGYASSLAYDIDMHNFHEIIGTIAGDDTIMLVIRENCTRTEVKHALANIIPNINQL